MKASYRQLIPNLITPDIAATRTFYEDVLGFECVGVFPPEGEPSWCHLQAGGAHVMFDHAAPHHHGDGVMHGHPSLSGLLFVYPEDVEELWGRVKDQVQVTMELTVTHYGMREFRIYDPNGYELAFSQEASA